MTRSGYTLIELLVVVSLLIGLMVGGTTLFLSNLQAGGVAGIRLSLARSARTLADIIENDLRYSKILELDNKDRSACIKSGTITGSVLAYENLNGNSKLLYLMNNSIIVDTGVDQKTNLSGDNTTVSSMSLIWYCQNGINDRMSLELSLSSSDTNTRFDVSETISRDINLLNSGLR